MTVSFRTPPNAQTRHAYCMALSSPVRRPLLDAGVRAAAAHGWSIQLDPSIDARSWFTAGDASTRSAAMHRWLDSQYAIGWNARGGYGSSELWPDAPLGAIADQNRWLVGSSDTTSLQWAMLSRHGYGSLYGPMLSGDLARQAPDSTWERVWHVLHGDSIEQPAVTTANFAGTISGLAVGGCLSMVEHALAAGFDLDCSGALIFLEDTGEHPFRIQRMLVALRQRGLFANARGIVFGTFPGCNPPEGADYTMRALCTSFAEQLGLPAVFDYPFGHVADGSFCDSIVWGASYEIQPGYLARRQA